MPEAAPEPGRPGGGHVEQEARQLVAAAARWLSAVPSDGGEYGDSRQEGPATDRGDREQDSTARDSSDRAQAEHGPEQCSSCPWCRAKAAVGPLGVDTLDSLAHLMGAAAESLQLFAQARREQAEGREHDAEGEDPQGEDRQQ